MKYKICSLILCSVFFLAAFKAEVKTTPRQVLLGQLDSLELEIQQKRRVGEPIDKIEEEIARLKWTIEESKSDTAQISDSLTKALSSADIETVKEEPSTTEKKSNGFEAFFREHSTLDIMIIIVGAIAALAIVLLSLFLIYVKLFKKVQPKPLQKQKSKKKAQPIPQKRAPAAKPKSQQELSAQEKRDTLEEIKSKLSALNDRHTKEQLQQNVRPVQEPFRAMAPKQPVGDDFENPFQQVQQEDSLNGGNPFVAASTIGDLSKRPTLGHPGVEPKLLPEQALFEETLEEQRRETVTAPIEEVQLERPLSLNDSIVSSFDNGDDVVTIAQNMNMSIDQIKMILRISGR